MLTKRDLLRSAALAAITATTAKSIPELAQTSADRPGFLKAKDIAEAGFIFGLPIVMNYGVMYEYAVDRNSGQFKAPFNQLKNESSVFTYKDTAIPTPNSDTPYSLVWMELRAEPVVLSVRAVIRRANSRVRSSTAIPITTAITAALPAEGRPAITWLSAPGGRARPRPGSR